jgi:hypothetical protein
MDDSFISLKNLSRFLENLRFSTVQKEDGKGLSSNDFTEDWINKIQAAWDHSRSKHFPPDDPIDLATNVINRIKMENLPLSNISNRVLVTFAADTNPVWDQINQYRLSDNSVNTNHIFDGSVIASKIANNAVTTDKIANGNVVTLKIADRNVTSEKIAARAVTGNELFTSSAANRVLTVGIANSDPIWNQVTQPMLAANFVGSGQLIDNNVTTAKILNQNVTTEKLADGAVVNEKITNNTIEGIKLRSSAIADRIMAVLICCHAGVLLAALTAMTLSAIVDDFNFIPSMVLLVILSFITAPLANLSVVTFWLSILAVVTLLSIICPEPTELAANIGCVT